MRMRLISLAVLGLLLPASLASAQRGDAKLPEGLRHVPLDALGFIHLRAGDFLKGDIGQQLMLELRKDREASKGLKEIEKTLGLEVADIDTVTLLMLNVPNQFPMRPWDMPPRRTPMNPRFDFDMPKKAIEFKLDLKKSEEKKDDGKDSPVLFQPGVFGQPFPDMMDPREFNDFPTMSEPLVIVTSTKLLDRKKILRSQVFQSRQMDPFGPGRGQDRKSTRLNSSHIQKSRMPSSA